MSYPAIPPGTLLTTIVERTRDAIGRGALKPIETDAETVPDGGIAFVVRRVSSLGRKEVARRTPGPANPFFPPERALVVGAIGTYHVGVLNKFPVIANHLLLATRDFEPQEALLTEGDLVALGACMREFPSLGFYNGGTEAGASQGHKHLQLVPRALTRSGGGLPIDAHVRAALRRGAPCRLDAFAFAHVVLPLPRGWLDDPARSAGDVRRLYRDALGRLGIECMERNGIAWQSAPYNALFSSEWMLVVRRSREHFEGISVNALGFAGSLFVKRGEELDRVRDRGPLTVLREVAAPPV